MTENQATEILNKAVEGGYKPTGGDFNEMVLSALFWQALGKSLGWYDHKLRGSKGECLECGAPQCEIEWHANWHRFIDHLASGGSVDEFFNDILK